MKIAWFTPFSKESAIGQYSAIVVSQLRSEWDLVLYASDLDSPIDAWIPDADIRILKSIEASDLDRELDQFDLVIYNLGDNLRFHQSIYETSLRVPGVVILHDLVMHHFFSGFYLQYRQDREGYLQELAFAHGEPGRVTGRAILDGTMPDVWHSGTMLDFHMAKSALRRCYGVVVHSDFARRAIQHCSSLPVWKVDFPTPRTAVSPKHENLTERPADAKVRFLTFGMINANKMVHQVISAFAVSSELREHATYDVIGRIEIQAYAEDLARLIRLHGLQDSIRLRGYQSDEILDGCLEEADVIVNLRNPHFGESSWVLLEAMYLAKPTVVWKHGYYDEFPDDTVVKVVDSTSLVRRLDDLCASRDLRIAIGRRARDHAETRFSTANYCERLRDIVECVLYDRPVLRLTDFVADYLRELGISSTDEYTLSRIADEVAALSGAWSALNSDS